MVVDENTLVYSDEAQTFEDLRKFKKMRKVLDVAQSIALFIGFVIAVSVIVIFFVEGYENFISGNSIVSCLFVFLSLVLGFSYFCDYLLKNSKMRLLLTILAFCSGISYVIALQIKTPVSEIICICFSCAFVIGLFSEAGYSSYKFYKAEKRK